MKMPVRLLALNLAIVSTSLSAAAMDNTEEFNTTRCEYSVESDGEKVGDMTLLYKIGNDATEVAEYSHLYALGWWGKWELHSQTIEQYTPSGKLLNADSKITESKNVYWIQIKKQDNEYWATAAKLKRLSQHETDELIELVSALSSGINPNLSEILSLSSAVLSDRTADSKSLPMATDSFDTTLNNLPLWLAKFHSEPLPPSVLLLDLESLRTIRMALTNHGLKAVNFPYYHGEATHLTLTPTKGEPLEIWLPLDHTPSPCALKIRGIDEDGPFVFHVKSID